MRFIVRMILSLTILGSLTVLWLNVRPGALDDLLAAVICLSVLWFPIGLFGSVVIGEAVRRRHQRSHLSRRLIAESLAIPLVALLTLVLLVFDVPFRITFLACRSAFEAAVANSPVSAQGIPFGARVGIYRVDERAVDPRGGTYFRVHYSAVSMGLAKASYGFVKGPNPKGTPFGDALYEVFHLVDDWYWFQTRDYV